MTSNGLGNAWVGNELGVVTSAGIPVRLHALYAPASTFFESEDMQRIGREARYLYPLPPVGFALSVLLAPLLFGPRYFSALWNTLVGPRESFQIRLKTIWHFLVAAHWARGLRGESVSHIHSQWIHSGGSVAMYGAWLLGVSYSFTGHAADLFRDRCALRDKIRRAKFIVCISKFHEEFFLKEGAERSQLRLAYCGIDTSHFSPSPDVGKHEPPCILSSGRLVGKKGFLHLVRACRHLKDQDTAFRCVIAGSGPDEAQIRAEIARLDLGAEIEVTGKALSQERIPEFMSAGDVYCLPCVWAKDGDIDGLPQMLMEAMACGLPAVSTRLVGIPDLIEHEQTGLLATPEDDEELARELGRLLADRALARQLAEAGRKRVIEVFDLSRSLSSLIAEYRLTLEST